jgi:cytochrome c
MVMNTRVVFSSAVLAFTMLGAGWGTQQSAAAQTEPAANAGATASAPGVRYEAHLNAGGVQPPAISPPQPPAGNASDAKAGEGLFASMNCDGCHGGGATGFEAPSLVDGRWRYGGPDEEVFQSIFYGRPKGMPAYGGVLGVDGVWMIVRYLKSQPVPAVVPTINYEELAKPAAPPAASAAPSAAASSEPSPPTDPSAKLAQYGCIACHAIDRKVVGPAFRDVAAKYRDQQGVAETLETKVKNGGGGVWGDIPMPPNSAVPDAEVHEIVNWILTSPDVRE